jgi:hypothetical protein
MKFPKWELAIPSLHVKLDSCVDDSEPRFAVFGDARLVIHDPLAFGTTFLARPSSNLSGRPTKSIVP